MSFVKNDNLKDLFAPITSQKKYNYLKDHNINPLTQKDDSNGNPVYIFDNNDEFKSVMEQYKKEMLHR